MPKLIKFKKKGEKAVKGLKTPIQIKISKGFLWVFGTLILLFIPIIIVFHQDIQFAINNDKFHLHTKEMLPINPTLTNLTPTIPEDADPRNNKPVRIQLSILNWHPKCSFNIAYPTIPKYDKNNTNNFVTIKYQLTHHTSYIFMDVFAKTKAMIFSLMVSNVTTNYEIGVLAYLNIDQQGKEGIVGFTIVVANSSNKADLYVATKTNPRFHQFSPNTAF